MIQNTLVFAHYSWMLRLVGFNHMWDMDGYGTCPHQQHFQLRVSYAKLPGNTASNITCHVLGVRMGNTGWF